MGINLVAADTVIIYDPDWNPQNDIQAQARCHRIGQTKAVQVYRLCTKDTYETVMLQTANHKLGLEHAVIKQGGYDGAGADGAKRASDASGRPVVVKVRAFGRRVKRAAGRAMRRLFAM